MAINQPQRLCYAMWWILQRLGPFVNTFFEEIWRFAGCTI